MQSVFSLRSNHTEFEFPWLSLFILFTVFPAWLLGPPPCETARLQELGNFLPPCPTVTVAARHAHGTAWCVKALSQKTHLTQCKALNSVLADDFWFAKEPVVSMLVLSTKNIQLMIAKNALCLVSITRNSVQKRVARSREHYKK